ncbi:MAG: cupin domain-containing protein [Candidatus Zixiibacteriota bacterium]
MSGKVNITEKLASFNKHWSPKIVGELNGQYVKVVKFKGEYVWHHHDNEDEMFLVIKGSMDIHLEDSVINLSGGEFYIVHRGIEHKPAAEEECHCLLFEPATTRNTGNVDHKYTIEPDDLEKL